MTCVVICLIVTNSLLIAAGCLGLEVNVQRPFPAQVMLEGLGGNTAFQGKAGVKTRQIVPHHA